MVYHSSMNDVEVQQVCGCSMLPIKTGTRGPAPLLAESSEQPDIIDEVLGFFKANVLFKQYEVKGGADRLLIYLTLYITQCLQRLEKCPTSVEGIKALHAAESTLTDWDAAHGPTNEDVAKGIAGIWAAVPKIKIEVSEIFTCGSAPTCVANIKVVVDENTTLDVCDIFEFDAALEKVVSLKAYKA